MVKVAVLSETDLGETRVAALPSSVSAMKERGLDVVVETGAGLGCGHTDGAYRSAGAQIAKNRSDTLKGADLVLRVRTPIDPGHLDLLSKNCLILGFLLPDTFELNKNEWMARPITWLSLDMVPRITRAQSMDALSSQTNLAGYRAVLEAVYRFDRVLPMMMTAAGTLAPAKVLVIGAGVAGLQAIATARRLGGVVSAFDVREAAKEQVESLGATFVTVPGGTNGEDQSGYAREMDATYQQRQKESIALAVQKSDIVITTALIPGKKAPLLITKSMIESMAPGSVVVDLAVASGGNCEGSKAGETVLVGGAMVVGCDFLPARVGRDASYLLSRNILKIVDVLRTDVPDGAAFNTSDDIIRAMTVLESGSIRHPLFQQIGKAST